LLQLLHSILILAFGLVVIPQAYGDAAKSSEPIPETDIGRIVVDFHTTDLDRNWIVTAHELNVQNMFKDSPRLLSLPKESLKLSDCANFSCRQLLLRDAKIDLYIEGTLSGDSLEYRALVPETAQVLQEGRISVSPNTVPEHVKNQFMHAMKPFTESGGILDQKTALRRAEKESVAQSPRVNKRTFAIALGIAAFWVLGVLFASIIFFTHGRRPLVVLGALWIFFALGPLWLISEDLALVKPVAIFALPEPWLLAVIGGLGVGWVLWGLCLCILPQLRGLETLKQERMPHVVNGLIIVFFYRALATLLWIGVASTLVLGAREIFGLDKVHTIALGLMVFGGLATLSALVFEILAQSLDRRLVIDSPTPANPWHERLVEALRGTPQLASLEDLATRVLFLPTQHDRPLAYGGGLSRPRILLPLATLEKAFATRPEDIGMAYDFLTGLVLDGLGQVSLRSHLETTLRLGTGLGKDTQGKSVKGFLLAPYRRSMQLLESCFLAVHDGLNPFIQYLYWRHNPASELLTVKAKESQLIANTRRILGKIQIGTKSRSIDKPRDHICWLVQNYIYPSQSEVTVLYIRGLRIRQRTAVIVVLISCFIGYHVVSAVLYHPIYKNRIAEQKARIEEEKKKKELEKEGIVHGKETLEGATPTTGESKAAVEPVVGTGGQRVEPVAGTGGQRVEPAIGPRKAKKVVGKAVSSQPKKVKRQLKNKKPAGKNVKRRE
jgi:hypothetical protein